MFASPFSLILERYYTARSWPRNASWLVGWKSIVFLSRTLTQFPPNPSFRFLSLSLDPFPPSIFYDPSHASEFVCVGIAYFCFFFLLFSSSSEGPRRVSFFFLACIPPSSFPPFFSKQTNQPMPCTIVFVASNKQPTLCYPMPSNTCTYIIQNSPRKLDRTV